MLSNWTPEAIVYTYRSFNQIIYMYRDDLKKGNISSSQKKNCQKGPILGGDACCHLQLLVIIISIC
jgi:hypothetical protein